MASDARSAPRTPPRRFTLADVGRLLSGWLVSSVTLMMAEAVQPNFTAASAWSLVAVAAVSGLVGLLARPLLVEVAVRLGWLAVLPLALVGQAVIIYLAMLTVPGIDTTFGAAFVTSWICAAMGTLAAYVATAGTDEGLTTALARRVRPEALTDPAVDGVVIVQIDGVPYPVLRWAVQAGGLPTIRRWVTSRSHRLTEWTAQLPCTTPASQLGILHGTVAGVPAFRWYDRDLGRVLVANRPGDARIIEDRASDGRGLLYDDGVSISNLFTGDAPRALLTMSRAGSNRGVPQTRRALAWFLLTPTGFARSLVRTIGEVVKERWQARMQERRQLDPRIRRGWTFAVLRAVTNALLRDLNTALVAEEMFRGTKVIYVDYVDYDEIAHHAGMFRPESLAALEGLDRVLGQLERLAERAPRRYRIVVVSDHGQSQGLPFADRYGVDLSALCSDLMAEEVKGYETSVEGWGRADALMEDIGHDGLSGRLAAPADRRVSNAVGDSEAPADVVVLGSGNLGSLYVPGPRRLTLDELTRRWPHLARGLCAHPGVGFIAAIDDDGIPWAMGSEGRCNLATGVVEGDDPLRAYGNHARRVLARAVLMPEAPDLYVNSRVDEDTLDIAAFEELVGAHGGLGGWQDRAVLLCPRELAASLPERVEGADELHRVLVGFLRESGQRRGQVRPSAGSDQVSPSAS
jgi:uncharacterized membrane protein YvlD (DUF360 family)